MTEQQRQTDNMLLQLIQRHFPSLPLSDEHTDWPKWLAFANAAHKAGADAERGECAGVAFRHSRAHEQASEKASNDLDRDMAVNMSLAADAVGQAIMARSNAEASGAAKSAAF